MTRSVRPLAGQSIGRTVVWLVGLLVSRSVCLVEVTLPCFCRSTCLYKLKYDFFEHQETKEICFFFCYTKNSPVKKEHLYEDF